jgi:hypothetical protein
MPSRRRGFIRFIKFISYQKAKSLLFPPLEGVRFVGLSEGVISAYGGEDVLP